MIYFTYLTDFCYFPLKIVFRKLLDIVRAGKKMNHLKGDVEGFRYFHWFQLFYFLTRIIPVNGDTSVWSSLVCLIEKSNISNYSPGGNWLQLFLFTNVPFQTVPQVLDVRFQWWRRVQKWRLHYPWITASIRRPPFWSTLLYAFPENGLVVILLPAILVNRFRHSLRKAWTWAWASGRCAFGLSILYFYCWLYRWMLQFDHSPREIYVWKIHIWKDMFLTKLPLCLYLKYFSYKVVIFIHIQGHLLLSEINDT